MGPQKAGFLALVRKDQEGLNGDKNGFRSWVEAGERGKETIQSVAVVRLIPGALKHYQVKN